MEDLMALWEPISHIKVVDLLAGFAFTASVLLTLAVPVLFAIGVVRRHFAWKRTKDVSMWSVRNLYIICTCFSAVPAFFTLMSVVMIALIMMTTYVTLFVS